MSIYDIKFPKGSRERKQFEEWMRALRSGKYSQGTGVLQSPDGYCCLGVACKVLTPSEELRLTDEGTLEGSMPDAQPGAPDWLKYIDRDFHSRLDMASPSSEEDMYITSMNDRKLMSFNKIADVLEAVYLHGALEDV